MAKFSTGRVYRINQLGGTSGKDGALPGRKKTVEKPPAWKLTFLETNSLSSSLLSITPLSSQQVVHVSFGLYPLWSKPQRDSPECTPGLSIQFSICGLLTTESSGYLKASRREVKELLWVLKNLWVKNDMKRKPCPLTNGARVNVEGLVKIVKKFPFWVNKYKNTNLDKKL